MRWFLVRIFSSPDYTWLDRQYALCDEFGHAANPHFSSIITTIRKYRVSISIVLQSLAQLQARYGEYEARTIA